MLLCDIGNSTYHFFDTKEHKSEKIAFENYDGHYDEKLCYYISVNPKFSPPKLWKSLHSYIKLKGAYEGLGVDRKLAMTLFDDAVVVDAGSAITVDVCKAGCYEGGFIYPGFRFLGTCYKEISPRLDYLLNFELSLDTMPKSTQNAISYGTIAPLVREIERLSYDTKLIITGGDAEVLKGFLKNATYRPWLLFEAMQKIIQTL